MKVVKNELIKCRDSHNLCRGMRNGIPVRLKE